MPLYQICYDVYCLGVTGEPVDADAALAQLEKQFAAKKAVSGTIIHFKTLVSSCIHATADTLKM